MRATILGFFTAVTLMFIVPPVAAQSTGPLFIDFEFFPGPDGELGTADDIAAPDCDLICFPLDIQFESLGLIFTSGWLFQGGFFPETPASNHFISSEPASVTLASPVFDVSIESYSVHDATLYGFDEMDQVIAVDTLEHPGGGDPFFGALRITSDLPVWRFLVQATECEIGGPCNPILNLDNLGLDFDDPLIFADGFESGDTTIWSSTVP